MVKVYDLQDDTQRVRAMQMRTRSKARPFMRTKWGLVGSPEWWDNIERNNLVHTIEGHISRVYMSGHNDFPEMEVIDNNGTTRWPRMGEETSYVAGAMIRIEYVDTSEAICALSPDSKTAVRIWVQSHPTRH